MPARKPHVGDIAHHPTLDSRPVAEVNEDRTKIKLQIGNIVTPWLPAKNYYKFTDPRA